jgi:hypothetical protein
MTGTLASRVDRLTAQVMRKAKTFRSVIFKEFDRDDSDIIGVGMAPPFAAEGLAGDYG